MMLQNARIWPGDSTSGFDRLDNLELFLEFSKKILASFGTSMAVERDIGLSWFLSNPESGSPSPIHRPDFYRIFLMLYDNYSIRYISTYATHTHTCTRTCASTHTWCYARFNSRLVFRWPGWSQRSSRKPSSRELRMEGVRIQLVVIQSPRQTQPRRSRSLNALSVNER